MFFYTWPVSDDCLLTESNPWPYGCKGSLFVPKLLSTLSYFWLTLKSVKKSRMPYMESFPSSVLHGRLFFFSVPREHVTTFSTNCFLLLRAASFLFCFFFSLVTISLALLKRINTLGKHQVSYRPICWCKYVSRLCFPCRLFAWFDA